MCNAYLLANLPYIYILLGQYFVSDDTRKFLKIHEKVNIEEELKLFNVPACVLFYIIASYNTLDVIENT